MTDLQVFPWFSVIELMSKITKIYLTVAQQLTICCQRNRWKHNVHFKSFIFCFQFVWDFKHWWRTMEVNGFLSKNSPSLSLMQILIKKAFPYNCRKLLVGQLLMCSSGCGAKKCAQHQITSYVQPFRATVKDLALTTSFSWRKVRRYF